MPADGGPPGDGCTSIRMHPSRDGSAIRMRASWRWGLGLPATLLAFALVPPSAAAPEACLDVTLAVDQDAFRVTLAWSPPANATLLYVERARDDFVFHPHAVLPGNATGFVDEAVPPGLLSYRVAADAPPTDACPAQTVHIHGPVGDGDPPGACAAGLAARADPDRSILLTWDPVPGAGNHRVHAVVDGAVAHELAILPADASSFRHEGLEVGAVHAYAVAADGPPGPACDVVAATAIPFFPSAGAGIAVSLVAAALFLAERHRRA